MPSPHSPAWQDLQNHPVPDWFRDAKFGIWAHWGAASVPRLGDWYARRMYEEGSAAYRHHLRHFGHPSQHGFKDMLGLWKAERFDPAALMERFRSAGAKYFVCLAVHHDNFDNWDSRHHRFNAVRLGPMRDIVGAWKDAARAAGLPFGVSEHVGASPCWWAGNKGADRTGPFKGIPYDGGDPAYSDLYHTDTEEYATCYVEGPAYQAHWQARMLDLVGRYEPELVYTDGPFPFGKTGLSFLGQYYALLKGQGVYTQKDTRRDVHTVGVLDVERGGMKDIFPRPWQNCTCLGNWFYDDTCAYKAADHIIEMLVDRVSKNGNLLLSVPMRPDGTVDDECQAILAEIGAYLAVNGEGIYGTRPWKRCGEGEQLRFFCTDSEERQAYGRFDFRFTAKGRHVYAFQMQPDARVTVQSLATGGVNPYRVPAVRAVTLLGQGSLAFSQDETGLHIAAPEGTGGNSPACFRITTDETYAGEKACL